MFDFIKEWRLKKRLEKKANRNISSSYINEQRRLYRSKIDSDATNIDVMNYMLLNDILDLSDKFSHNNRENYNSSYVEFHSSNDRDKYVIKNENETETKSNHETSSTHYSSRSSDNEVSNRHEHYSGGGHGGYSGGSSDSGGGGGGSSD